VGGRWLPLFVSHSRPPPSVAHRSLMVTSSNIADAATAAAGQYTAPRRSPALPVSAAAAASLLHRARPDDAVPTTVTGHLPLDMCHPPEIIMADICPSG